MYEYFPNKEALFEALLARYRVLLEAALAEKVDILSGDWRIVVGGLFDVFVEFYREQPGYRTLWLGSQLTDVLLETGRVWGNEFAEELAPVLGVYAPRLDEERRVIVTQAALHLVSALVTAALQSSKDREQALIEEGRLALYRYLEPEMGERVAEK